MKFLEKDLELIIWEANDEQLENAGLEFRGKRFRQLKIGNYGVADLVTAHREWIYANYLINGIPGISDNYLVITIYELKKDKVGIGAFLQAIGYAKGISSYFRKRDFENFVIRIVLIGSDIDMSGNFCYLPNLLGIPQIYYEQSPQKEHIDGIDFYSYKITLDGLKFKNESGCCLKNEGF